MDNTVKRILFLIQLPPPVHGASTMNLSVYNAIKADERFLCHLIPLDFAKDMADLQKVRVGKIFKAIGILFRLIRQLISFRPDVVYFSMVPHGKVMFRDSIYLLTIKCFGQKATPVLHFHRPGFYEYYTKKRLHKYYQWLFKGCTIIHLTENLVNKELAPLQLEKSQVYAISNFVEIVDEQKIIIAEKEPFHLLFIGNLYPHKGYLEAVKAITIVKQQETRVKLTIAGMPIGKESKHELETLIEKLNLMDNVEYVGFADDHTKELLFKTASILLLPSTQEYFPLVILEAMQYKLAAICYCKKQLESVFTHEEEIIYLETNQPEEIARSINQLFANQTSMNEIGEKAKIKSTQVQQSSIETIKAVLLGQPK